MTVRADAESAKIRFVLNRRSPLPGSTKGMLRRFEGGPRQATKSLRRSHFRVSFPPQRPPQGFTDRLYVGAADWKEQRTAGPARNLAAHLPERL